MKREEPRTKNQEHMRAHNTRGDQSTHPLYNILPSPNGTVRLRRMIAPFAFEKKKLGAENGRRPFCYTLLNMCSRMRHPTIPSVRPVYVRPLLHTQEKIKRPGMC